jgi:hypothetical protein
VVEVEWSVPVVDQRASLRDSPKSLRILFPASTLARKGAPVLREALIDLMTREIAFELLVLGRATEDPQFWKGITHRQLDRLTDDVWLSIDVVALPAAVENAPRVLLQALARGVPVIASEACGLSSMQHWFEGLLAICEPTRKGVCELLIDCAANRELPFTNDVPTAVPAFGNAD